MAELVRGPLVTADLGGYTRFLGGTELAHAHDILADLLGVVAEGLRASIRVEKLEGDAVFCADGTGTVPVETVLSTIESCYASFARRRRTIDSGTTRASPAQLWELLTDPRHQRVWKVTATSVEMNDPTGARGVGSQTHCVHGKTAVDQEIVDYKPPRHMTYEERNPLGRMLWSGMLDPVDGGGTRLTLTGRLLEGRLQRAKLVFARRIIKREVGHSLGALIQYGDRVAADV